MRVYYLNDTQKAEWKKQFNSLYQSFEANATKQTLDIIQQIKISKAKVMTICSSLFDQNDQKNIITRNINS